MKWMSLALVLLTCSIPCFAGSTTPPAKLDFGPGNVFEYDGTIGQKLHIGLTLRISNDSNTVTGCYFYDKYRKDIRISGAVDGRAFVIHEYDADGHETGPFAGEFPAADPRNRDRTKHDLQAELMTGYWSKPDGSKREPFYLTQTYSGSWLPGSRYAAAGFDDEHATDGFMSRFRQAVLDADVDRVTGMIRFPIDVNVDGKRVRITAAEDFRRDYNKMFIPAFVQRIRQSPPCHMFARDQGVMLGRGEVWVAPVRHGAETIPAVIAINNDAGSRHAQTENIPKSPVP